jgi:DNA-binding transcriptional regulator YbjK
MSQIGVQDTRTASLGTESGDAASIALPARGRRSPATERAEERRRSLLEAALLVIGQEGIDAISHRRVAEVANVPLGSTTYYFASREDMLVQSLEYFARNEIEALERAFVAVPDDVWVREGIPGLVQRLTDFLAPQLGETSWRTLAQYTLFQEAARRPELRPVVSEWNEAWWQILAKVLAALDRPHTRIDCQMLLAMFDGLLLAGTAEPQDDYADKVLRPALERWLGQA